jgi:2-iminobutanoate/2-iminopropanoate deaminase
VNPGTIVVISGQAALDKKGAVVGETIEEQTRITLQNCFAQLQAAGCGPADVFKANVFMSDLSEWERMNQVYVELMPEPRPVRTTVGVNLLMSFKIEIEMWAVRR